jgi:hypothetical protein
LGGQNRGFNPDCNEAYIEQQTRGSSPGNAYKVDWRVVRIMKNHDRQRRAGFLCRVRKFKDEATVRRVLWAIRLNRNHMAGCAPKYCELCQAWHIARS